MNTKKLFVPVIVIALLIGSAIIYAGESSAKAENFKLKDYNGKEHQLSDFTNAKSIVLMFVSTQCPVSNAYNERMAKLYNDYKDKGIVFLGINSNKAEGVDDIKKHAAENHLMFPILKDEKNIVADKLSASVTPEIYVLNGKLDILYHGRIDDSQRESNITSSDLKTALDDIIAGKNMKFSKTKAFGCSIKRVGK
ncbi:MAG: hypothetical protein CVV24_05090 [Ignavibacteriae bacterium HGW-Ignavibacteriae-3]|nr:MAG: hypothetical protein CVV24_05090 [Ignavibacteriae bacterium HGW-Ignavibacteriae-3]